MRAGSDRPFPDNDLSYIAFVVTAYFNLIQVDAVYDPEQPRSLREEAHWFLDEVPLLSHLPGSIQIDLLATVWTRHTAKKVYQASLLDGAVLYAACREATDVLASDPRMVRRCLTDATRDLDIRLDRWTLNQLKTLYERWWRSFDPSRVHSLSELVDFPRRMVEPLEVAQHYLDVDLDLGKKLRGLVRPDEIRHFVDKLTAPDDQP
jgi:hypothetical protein